MCCVEVLFGSRELGCHLTDPNARGHRVARRDAWKYRCVRDRKTFQAVDLQATAHHRCGWINAHYGCAALVPEGRKTATKKRLHLNFLKEIRARLGQSGKAPTLPDYQARSLALQQQSKYPNRHLPRDSQI